VDDATRRTFVRSCWVPAALWVATLLYIRPYDGWGAWAAAPLLLPSVLLSAAWGLLGISLLGRAVTRRQPVDLAVLAATAVGSAPVLYYTLRHLLRSAG
jgi:hypothetical protein